MRSLKVVVLDEQRHAALAVLEVREHRAAEEFLPQGLPEPLDLAASLRMVRAALHMMDAVAFELRFELRGPAPGGVLSALVGQDLLRRSVLGNGACECLEHEHAPLMVGHHQAHEVAGVIVQKCRDINTLVASQQEREEIGLPQLIGLGPFEVFYLLFAPDPPRGFLRLDAFRAKHSAHRGLRGSDPQEPPHHISDAARA